VFFGGLALTRRLERDSDCGAKKADDKEREKPVSARTRLNRRPAAIAAAARRRALNAGAHPPTHSQTKTKEYRLVAKKGEGTFSEVLKAQCIRSGKFVAIKCMKNRFDSIEQVWVVFFVFFL
jgi:serine/threonine protein kinase